MSLIPRFEMDWTDLVEDLHFQNALIVTPHLAFNLPIPDTSRHIICLEMPSCTNIFKLVGLFTLNIAWPPFCKVLDDEGTGCWDRGGDDDRAFLETYDDTRAVRCDIHTAAQYRLGGER